MKEEIIDSGSFAFKPRARLIKTIGEELISNDNVAITELVKNSYDARASIVEITFRGNVKEKEIEGKKGSYKEKYIEKRGASITVFDDGTGMDFETVQKAWMEPATNYKKKAENQNPDRKFTGEKGIGRFASAKLSSRLELITKQADKDEIVVVFDWNDFSNEDNYLEDVKIQWFIRPAKEIKTSGTILKLVELNEDWDEVKICDLRVSLSRLLNPIVPTEDFLININLPKPFGESMSGFVERPETLNRPNYYIKGSITEEGCPLNVVFYSKNKGQEEALSLSNNLFTSNRTYTAGPFAFEFKIWNRDNENLNALASETNSIVRNVKQDLDDLCGISIYRDNIRVLPYGNQNNDWVRLDIRRVNNPTLRLSNNQIVGYISIGLETNPSLKDQSSREGIVESQAFEDIKDYIKLILNEVEQRRYNERPRENQTKKTTKTSLFEKLSLTSLSDEIKENNPSSKEILDLIDQKDAEIKDTVTKIQEVISRYRRLSTLGQLIDPIIHDGRNCLGKIDTKTNIIIKEANKTDFNMDKILEKANEIQTIRKDFAQLFKRIEPFGGRKRGRPQTIIIEEVIKNQFLITKEELDKQSISYHVSETKHSVTIDESEVTVVFMNLIQNSIYWLSTVDSERKIDVNVSDEQDGLSIVISDSGPGIQIGMEESIFDPYFSTKPDGIGLGLAIVGEIMSEYDGELSLIKDATLSGAAFKLLFRKRI